jgi:hypothetical protein
VAAPSNAGAPANAAPATTPIDVCADAFADQRQLYVDAEVEVHPDHQTTFVALCQRLPPTLQRCASPLYQIDHALECDRARDASSRAESDAWHRMFDVLTGDATRLALPMGRDPA